MSETLERHEFGTEVGRLLDLVVHALYSDREIFLRELVANAADAVDRRRFEALTDSTLGLPAEARVRIVPDKAARTLTISDPGIGMSKAELAQHLGHHRPLGHAGLHPLAGPGAGHGEAQPDRPVRRRLLLGLHGGGAGRGHLPPRRR